MTRDGAREGESPLSRAFAKDESEEDFLQDLNAHLQGFGEAGPDPSRAAEPVPCFIIGTPRSGTTLLNQLLANCLSVGYVNNLIAAFWKAPVVGIRLSKKLLGKDPAGSFESSYGRTRGVAEPHEFGYFWRDLLGPAAVEEKAALPEERWAELRRYMILFGREFEAPFAMKTFWAGWHVPVLRKLLPRAHFLFVERELEETAASILLARRAYAGSEEAWIGPRPAGLEALEPTTPAEEVAAQLLLLRMAHDGAGADGEGTPIHRVGYPTLCTEPQAVLDRLLARLRLDGAEVEQVASPPALTPRDPFLTEGPGGGAVEDAEGLRREIRAAFQSVRERIARDHGRFG